MTDDLPVSLMMGAFDRGIQPANIAESFGLDVPLVVEVITTELSHRGFTAEQIAERFAAVWGLRGADSVGRMATFEEIQARLKAEVAEIRALSDTAALARLGGPDLEAVTAELCRRALIMEAAMAAQGETLSQVNTEQPTHLR